MKRLILRLVHYIDCLIEGVRWEDRWFYHSSLFLLRHHIVTPTNNEELLETLCALPASKEMLAIIEHIERLPEDDLVNEATVRMLRRLYR